MHVLQCRDLNDIQYCIWGFKLFLVTGLTLFVEQCYCLFGTKNSFVKYGKTHIFYVYLNGRGNINEVSTGMCS